MKSTRKHYCACNPRSKTNREEAKWYCFRHRRHLCDNCIYDELNQRHISCMVGSYQSFIKSAPSQISSFKHNKCPICDKILPDDDARAVVRLNCACVYHTTCLQQYLLSNTSNNVPCVKCNTMVTIKPKSRSNLGDSVDRFLRSVSRQRLWNKPKNTGTSSSKPISSTISSISSSTQNQNHMQHITSISSDNAPEVIESTSIHSSQAPSTSTSYIASQQLPKKPITQSVTTGHIAVDMTRHRAGHGHKTSLNRDGNKDDDKYNKPIRRGTKHTHTHYKSKGKSSKGMMSWFTTRKTLVILLLCFAFIAQCWFMYMVFIKPATDGSNNNINVDNNNLKNKAQVGSNQVNMNPDQKIRAQQGNIEGLVHNLPPNLKNQILGGNKLGKLANLRNRMIK